MGFLERWQVLGAVFPPPTQASSSSHGRQSQATNQGLVERDAFVLACRHGEEPAAAGGSGAPFPLCTWEEPREYDGSPSGLVLCARCGFQRAPHSQSVWMAKGAKEV